MFPELKSGIDFSNISTEVEQLIRTVVGGVGGAMDSIMNAVTSAVSIVVNVVIGLIFSLYVSLWSVIISLWSVFVSLAACAFGGVVSCVIFAIGGHGAVGLAMLAAGMVCAGLSIFMFLGCKAATKGIVILTKKIAIWIKNCFMRKEEA